MGSSTGDLLMNDDETLEKVFQIAAKENMMVAVHAEDEIRLQENKKQFQGKLEPAAHSKIRDRQAAENAVNQAISLAEKHKTKLFILHISAKEEVDLIRAAKNRGVDVHAETTPHHLFLNEMTMRNGEHSCNEPTLKNRERSASIMGRYS